MSKFVQPTQFQRREEELVPRVMVRGVFALVTICLILVCAARITNRPLEATPSQSPIIVERVVFLSGDSSGAVTVLDAQGSVIVRLSGEDGGFIAGVKRVIDRERMKYRTSDEAPVLLRIREGNRLSIHDPSTGFTAELMGFGAKNLRSFTSLLRST
ncbi:MAG: photosynthetic complex assembly protein PuhC [Aestuariivita sp.]|nr:photosynthetic complex assembly protein PuhC [Aestuariivita sp.]